MEKLHTAENNPQLKSDYEDVLACISNAVIAETHGSRYDNAHGVSIYLPDQDAYAAWDYFFEPQYSEPSYGLDFALQTLWVEFLDFVYSQSTVAKCAHHQLADACCQQSGESENRIRPNMKTLLCKENIE